MKTKSLLASVMLAVALLGLAGCASAPDEDTMPKGATNITQKGNGWVTFDMEINGETHTFLYGRHGMLNQQREAITEVSR